MTWSQIAELFQPLAVYYRELWGCRAPEYNQAPSASVSVECDSWCRKLAGQLADPIYPPEHLRGWILVRLACLAAAGRFLDKSSLPAPEKLDRASVEWLLVDLWHELLRDFWPKLARDERFFSA